MGQSSLLLFDLFIFTVIVAKYFTALIFVSRCFNKILVLTIVIVGSDIEHIPRIFR